MPVYTVNLSARQVALLEDRIFDVQEWIDEAVAGKINNSKKNLIKRYAGEYMGGTDEEDHIDRIFASPGYQNRSEREPGGRVPTDPPEPPVTP